MKFTYISERLNYRITSIFRKEDIPVRLAHKSYTRRALSHNNKERTNCAYYAMLFTKWHATTATSTTSGALYALSTIVWGNTWTMTTPPRRNTSLSAKTKSTKASKLRALYEKTIPQICDCSKHFSYESTNLPWTPERNAANSRTFYSRNYSAYLIYTQSLDHTTRFYSHSYLIYLRHFTPTFSRFSHIFTLHLCISPTRNIFFLSLMMPWIGESSDSKRF